MGNTINLNETTAVSEFDLSESPERKGILGTMEGTFAEFGEKNRNNRLYTKELWEKVINSDYVQEMMEYNTLFGEADHPEDRFEISLPEISHVVTDLWVDEENNEVKGKVDILNTPNGRILKTIVEYGSKIGISSRACGSVEEQDGVDVVLEDDYTFFTFDTVSNPGFGGSRLDVKELSEQKETDSDINKDKMKEAFIKELESTRDKNLEFMRKVVEEIDFDKDDYNELVEKIDELQEDEDGEESGEGQDDNKIDENNEGKNKEDKKTSKEDNLLQENTLSLLEEVQRDLYKLERKDEKMKGKVSSISDEVNSLSEGLEEKFPEVEVEKISDEGFEDSMERLDKIQQMIKQVKSEISDIEIVEKDEDDVEISEEDLEEIDKTISKLKREVKSKEIYAESLEERLEEISDESLRKEESLSDIKENEKELRERIKKLREKLNSYQENNEKTEDLVEKVKKRAEMLEDFVIEHLAGKTGVDKGVVEKYLPEDFKIKNISEIERKIRREIGDNKRRKIDRPIKVNESSKKREGSTTKSKDAKRLTNLIKSVGGKK